MKFTDVSIRALKPGQKRYVEWADGIPGFGVRVTPRGTKSWIYMYYRPEGYRMMTLGKYPAMTLAQARKAFGEAQTKVEVQGDPAGEKLNQIAEDRAAMTVGQLATEYMERWAKPRKRSWKNDEQVLKKDVLPRWRKRKAKDIKRRDVIKLLDDIVHRSAPAQANHTLSILRRMFNFAIERDILEYTPCHRVKKPAPENKKDRALSDAEIKSFWEGFKHEDNDIGLMGELVLKSILLTGQRPLETCSMRLSELDNKMEWWTLPASKTKNKRQHRVPLSSFMREIINQAIEARPEREADSDYVFASSRKAGMHLARDYISRKMRENLKFFGLHHNPATPHDLRRTFATEGGRIGIQREYRKRVLNHIDNDVTSIYDLYEYDREKTKALEKWADHVKQLVEEPDCGNIIPFRR